MDYKIYGIYKGEVHRIEVGRTGEVFLCPDTGDATDDRYPNRASLIAHSKIIKPDDIRGKHNEEDLYRDETLSGKA